MKIENTKNSQVDLKQTPAIAKNERNVFVSNPILSPNAQTASAKSTGSFAKILDDARHESTREKDKTTADKGDAPDAASTLDEKDETKNLLETERKEESEEKGGDGESSENSDEENRSGFNAQTAKNPNQSSGGEISFPAARSILHVADLERIISQIRSQETANQKEILLTLKHSVLEGLQIKLTADENGSFNVVFIAVSPDVEQQLKKRRQELFDILKQRSKKFSAVDVLLA